MLDTSLESVENSNNDWVSCNWNDFSSKGIVVLISGNGSNLQALIDYGFEIKKVFSNNSNAKGLQRAKEANIPTQAESSLKALEKIVTKFCYDNNIKLIVLAGFMRLLSNKFTKRWNKKCVNIHPSLLPSFPGITAGKQALDYGVKYTGVTVHYVDEGMDTGEIISQQPIYIEEWDDEDSLHTRLQKIEHKIYPQTINYLLKSF